MKPLCLVSNTVGFCGKELETRFQASKPPVNAGRSVCCSSGSVRPQVFLTQLQMRQYQILVPCRGIELLQLSSHFGCQVRIP